MSNPSWTQLFIEQIGEVIEAYEWNTEIDNLYQLANWLKENKLARDGSQNMTGNLEIAKSYATLQLTHDTANIMRMVVGSKEINFTVNAYFDGTNWQRDDQGSPAKRLRLFYVDGTTPTSMIYYEAPAGANPITWTEQWRINADGTTNIKPLGIVMMDSYSNTQLQLDTDPNWTTLATLNLTVPPGSNKLYLIKGYLNTTASQIVRMRILEGTNVIVNQTSGVGASQAWAQLLTGERVRTLSPGNYTYTLQANTTSSLAVYRAESNLVITGGWLA